MRNFALFALSCMAPAAVQAHNGGRCSHDLAKIVIQGSGRDSDRIAFYQDASQEIYHKIAPQLGYQVPDMMIQSLTPNSLVGMIGGLGDPAPFWLDGYSILQAASKGTSILEFIEAGHTRDLQYLNDTSSDEATLIVLSHVAGHYDFNKHFILKLQRAPDRIFDSSLLASKMGELIETEDYEEVTRYYQWLQSLASLQDFSRGSIDLPERYKNAVVNQRSRLQEVVRADGKPIQRIVENQQRHPLAPTRSVMQAMVYNLPASAAPWKTELLELFERKRRLDPVFYHGRIINEGWATFSEYLILKHSKYNSPANAIEFGNINAGISARPDLSSPYFTGVQAWFILYERFLKRPEIANLSVVDQDRQFADYARDLMQSGLTDYSLLRLAYNHEFVERNGFLLYRKQKPNEVDDPQAGPKNLAITRDPERIADLIAHRVANSDLKRPRIEIVDFNKSGRVVLRHDPYLGIPLDPRSIGPTLYVLAQILEKPVTLETIGSGLWVAYEKVPLRIVQDPVKRKQFESFYGELPYPPIEKMEDLVRTFKVRLTVGQNGELIVEEGEQALSDQIKSIVNSSVQAYMADSQLSYVIEPMRADFQKYIDAAMTANNIRVDSAENHALHAASASRAIIEYMNFMSHRLHRIMEEALRGERSINISANAKSIGLKVLPAIPSFELDRRAKSLRASILPTSLPDRSWANLSTNPFDAFGAEALGNPSKSQSETSNFPMLRDEDLELGQGPYLPGESWKPKPQGNGQAQGEQGDEAEEGEPGEDEGGTEPGQARGEGGSEDNPADFKIPTEVFLEALLQKLSLKNIRETEGNNKDIRYQRKSSVRKSDGEIHIVKTAQEAMRLGMAAAIDEGKDIEEMDPQDILELGYTRMKPEHLHVYRREEHPKPFMKAVVMFVADRSGSMDEHKRRIEKTFAKLTTALLRKVYDDIELIYVGYGTEAEELSEKDYYKKNTGGGTEAVSGYKKADEVLKRFPRSQYNRYIFNFSDGDDFNTEAAVEMIRKLAEQVEYMGYAHIDAFGMYRGEMAVLSQAFKALAQEDSKKIGYAELGTDGASMIRALLTYFGKD